MLPMLLVTAAFAAKKEFPDSDVVAQGVIAAPTEQVYEYLLDLHHHEQIWPSYCAVNWQYGDVTVGPGASARLTYAPGSMKRRLTAVISKVDDGRRVTVDHPGNKGFVTTWTLTPQGDATQLEIHTWINPPPWPLRGFYYNKVQQDWKSCHEQILDKLDTLMRVDS